MPSEIKAAENVRTEMLLMVSRGMLRGESPGETAARLRTEYRDLTAQSVALMQEDVMDLWRTQTLENSLLLRRREVERLTEVLREAFASWEKSKKPEVVTTEFRKRLDRDEEEPPETGRRRRRVSNKNADEHEYAVTGIKTQYRQRDEGNPTFLALVKDTSAAIRSLLGLDEPSKSMHLQANVEQFTPDLQREMMKDPKILKAFMDIEEMRSKVLGLKELPKETANVDIGDAAGRRGDDAQQAKEAPAAG